MRHLLQMAGFIALSLGARALAQARPDGAQPVRHLAIETAYVRETTDQAWHIRVAGSLPRPPGLYVIVRNEQGDLVQHGEIPSGVHPPEKPVLLEIPADGRAQQYAVRLVGQQDNVLGITLPLTDLPLEVYAGASFAMTCPAGAGSPCVPFQVRPGAENLSLAGSGGFLRVFDETGQVVADSLSTGGGASNTVLQLALKAGQTYWIAWRRAADGPALKRMDAWESGLMSSTADLFLAISGPEKLYLACDPSRWFAPSAAPEAEPRRWWEGVGR